MIRIVAGILLLITDTFAATYHFMTDSPLEAVIFILLGLCALSVIAMGVSEINREEW
jgi:uncharacterized membrane protein YjjP (DUF1212 family)